MPTLTGVTLSPAGPVAVYNGAYVTFTATAHYDDGSSEPLGPIGAGGGTLPATFSSSDTTIATVNSSTAFFGRAYGVAVGTATITVQMAYSPVDALHSATATVN